MIVFPRKIGSKKRGRLKAAPGSGDSRWGMGHSKASRGRMKSNKRGQGMGKMGRKAGQSKRT